MHILLIVQPRMINLQFALYSLLAIRLANSSQCQICIYVRKYLRKENYSIALCHLHLGTFSLHHVFIAGLKCFAVCCNVRFNLRKNDTVQRLCDDGNINAQPARAAASVSKYGLRMKVVLKPESHQSNRNRNRSPCIYAANKSIHIQFFVVVVALNLALRADTPRRVSSLRCLHLGVAICGFSFRRLECCVVLYSVRR